MRCERSVSSSRSDIAVISSPPTHTCPDVGRSRPAITDSSVDLPDPDGPSTAMVSPGRTVRVTSCSATVSPVGEE